MVHYRVMLDHKIITMTIIIKKCHLIVNLREWCNHAFLNLLEWVGDGGLFPSSTRCVGGPFNLKYHNQGYLNNPIFFNSGLCAACWAHFLCHDKLWTSSVSHLFSFRNIPLGLAGGNHYQKWISLFLTFPKKFAFPGCLAYILFYT